MKTTSIIVAVAALASTPVQAAPPTDLAVSLTPPAGVHVYEAGTYSVLVRNLTNQAAAGVVLTVELPETHTSPAVHVLGDLGAHDSRCVLAGTTLACTLGTLAKKKSTTVAFTIALPYSSAPTVFDAVVDTSSTDSNPANDTVSYTANPLTYAVAMSPPESVINHHCTGTGLISYFECELYPSSISSHESVFNADGTLDFVDAPPGYTGTWATPTPDHLLLSYFEDGELAATFDGRGVSASCFEGPTTFPLSAYMAIYQVCLQ